MNGAVGPTGARERSVFPLWAGWLLGPLGWAFHETASYILTPWACGEQVLWPLILVSLAGLSLAILGGALAWPRWAEARRMGEGGTRPDRALGRTRFLTLGGMLIAALSAAGIVVETLPVFWIDPCL